MVTVGSCCKNETDEKKNTSCKCQVEGHVYRIVNFGQSFYFVFINRKEREREREREDEGNQIKFAIIAFLLWSKSSRIAKFPA